MRKKINENDLEYVSSLSEAVLSQNERKTKWILNVVFLSVIWLIVWATYAEIDEITRGDGRIIPFSKNQMVQNLEGGIVSEILVKIGAVVEQRELLLKIDNKGFESSFAENQIKLNELEARRVRLFAEANDKFFKASDLLISQIPLIVANEKSLYTSHKKHLKNQLSIINEQIFQKKMELKELQGKIKNLKKSLTLINKEVKITKPLVDRGIESKKDFFKLKREQNGVRSEIENIKLSIPRVKSGIKEFNRKIQDVKLAFKNKAKREYNEIRAEIERIKSKKSAVADQVKRTLVVSPVKGKIKQIFVNTIGGVVKPGMNLIEIVPMEEKLVIEAKIKPSDIAFLYPNQKAVVKFTAYDFSIYGGLDGKVTNISADTIKDEKDNSFYLVRIETDKNFLGNEKKQLAIIPGMTVSVDIFTGKKTIMDYILKPILKAKRNALTER